MKLDSIYIIDRIEANEKSDENTKTLSIRHHENGSDSYINLAAKRNWSTILSDRVLSCQRDYSRARSRSKTRVCLIEANLLLRKTKSTECRTRGVKKKQNKKKRSNCTIADNNVYGRRRLRSIGGDLSFLESVRETLTKNRREKVDRRVESSSKPTTRSR